ncbi:MAG TPA: hypothetical protein VFV58_15330 [Blastocatellia bacterium]|jgi:hypothetical protein|nr:hypothetical protein [Blastocatellia bacterium]
MNSSDRPGFIPPHGHYQESLSYHKAKVVYDPAFNFCERFLNRGGRSIDQMAQPARSGKQNIRSPYTAICDPTARISR